MRIALNWNRRLCGAEMQKMMNGKNRQCLMPVKHARAVSNSHKRRRRKNTAAYQDVLRCEPIRR